MDDLIHQLERYREASGLRKSQISRLIGANSAQQYNNWVYRKSLPKKFYGKAFEILKANGESALSDQEIICKFRRLPESRAKIVLALIDELTPD